jgi:hypothetical protein
VLNWFTQPLVNGSTYDVRVNVLVNGQWSGFCEPACAVTILNPPMTQDGRSFAVGTSDLHASIYPNPVRDGRITVRLDDLKDEHQRISIDIYDLQGERVFDGAYENDGDVFSRVVELDASMAAGTYLLRIVVNGTASTHRLSVTR